MTRFLDALRRILAASWQALAQAWDFVLGFLSVPINLCLSVLCLVFAISMGAWAFGEPFEKAVLYFPDPGAKGALRGEVRNVPHVYGTETKAELIVSELLLGPQSTSLSSAFEPGVRVESAMYRKGRLFIDISPEAALASQSSLRNGVEAMDRSLKSALPGLKRISLTIGGLEPFAMGLQTEGGANKKAEKN
jgi:hypothetical protein